MGKIWQDSQLKKVILPLAFQKSESCLEMGRSDRSISPHYHVAVVTGIQINARAGGIDS